MGQKHNCKNCNPFRPINHDDQFVKEHNDAGFVKLAPCPFCGKRSQAFLSCYTSIRRDHKTYHAAVHCFNCGCSGPTAWGEDQEAVALKSAHEWNIRWEHPSKRRKSAVAKKQVTLASAVQKALYITSGFRKATNGNDR